MEILFKPKSSKMHQQIPILTNNHHIRKPPDQHPNPSMWNSSLRLGQLDRHLSKSFQHCRRYPRVVGWMIANLLLLTLTTGVHSASAGGTITLSRAQNNLPGDAMKPPTHQEPPESNSDFGGVILSDDLELPANFAENMLKRNLSHYEEHELEDSGDFKEFQQETMLLEERPRTRWFEERLKGILKA